MSVKSLVTMILNGPNRTCQIKSHAQTYLTVCQMLMLNTKKNATFNVTTTRYSLKWEPPLPIYIGLKVYTACITLELVCHFAESYNKQNA